MDRRTRKTQSAIYSAFVSLIVERGYDTISVQQIIDEADVGRTTFYAHFRSKDDLLMFGFQRLRDDLQRHLDDDRRNEPWSFLKFLLEHARSHLGLYRALLRGNGGPLAERSLLIERVDEAALRDRARDPDDLALLRSLGLVSCIVVPLWARGRALGTITLLTRRSSGRRYGEADLRFAEVLSGRAALA